MPNLSERQNSLTGNPLTGRLEGVPFPLFPPENGDGGEGSSNSPSRLILPGILTLTTIAGCGPSQVETHTVPTLSPEPETSKDILNQTSIDFEKTKGIIAAARGEIDLAPTEITEAPHFPEVNTRLPTLPGVPPHGKACPGGTFRVDLTGNPDAIEVGDQPLDPIIAGGGGVFSVLSAPREACAIINPENSSAEDSSHTALVINGETRFFFPDGTWEFTGADVQFSRLSLETQAKIMARLSIHWKRFLTLDEKVKSEEADENLQIAALRDYVSVLNLLQTLAEGDSSMANKIYDYINSVLLLRQEQYVAINNDHSKESGVKPEDLQVSIDAVLHRDEQAKPPELIASLVLEQTQRRQEVLDFINRVNLGEDILYYFYFQDTKEGYQEETNFSILSWLLPKGNFEEYQEENPFSTWIENKKTEWLNQHEINLDQAYQQYLQAYGISPEEVTLDVFKDNILTRFMLDDLIRERGLKQDDLEGIIRDILITAFNNYGQAREILLGQMAGQLGDPGFREGVRRTLEDMKQNEASFPDGVTVDDLMAGLDSANFSISEEEIQNAAADLAKEIGESLQYLGKVQEIHLEIPGDFLEKEKTLVQKADGSAFYLFFDDQGKEVTVSGRIVDSNGETVNLTQTNGFHPVDWRFISDDDTITVESSRIKINWVSLWMTIPDRNLLDECDSLIGREKPYSKLGSVRFIQIHLQGDRFVRLAFFPDEKGGIRIGAIVKNHETEEEQFRWFNNLGNKGSEEVGEYRERVGQEMRLLPGFYGQNGESLNEILKIIFGGEAITTSQGFQGLDPNIILERALAESLLQTPNPSNVFSVIIPRTSINNLRGESSTHNPSSDNVPIYLATNGLGWNLLQDQTGIFLEGATLVQSEQYQVNPKTVKIGGEEFYILTRAERPQGEIADNLVGWQLLESLLKRKLGKDEVEIALLVPVGKVKVINKAPWIEKLWKAGGVKDILLLTTYFGSLAVLGELNLAGPEALPFFNQLMVEMGTKTQILRFFAYLALSNREEDSSTVR